MAPSQIFSCEFWEIFQHNYWCKVLANLQFYKSALNEMVGRTAIPLIGFIIRGALALLKIICLDIFFFVITVFLVPCWTDPIRIRFLEILNEFKHVPRAHKQIQIQKKPIFAITNMSETAIKTRNWHGVRYFPHFLKTFDCITIVFRQQWRCMAARFWFWEFGDCRSIKNIFSIDCAIIYFFLSMYFVQWKYVGLTHIAYIVIC